MFRSFSDKKSPRKSFRLKPPFTRHAISILICAACMLCATLASFLYQHIVPDNHANVALFYILALVIIARWTVGYGYGIVCTLFSVIAINYLFTYPYYKLNFTLTGYPITFLLMSGITLILCTMTSHMTIQSEMIAEREKRLAEAEMEKMRANLLRAISHDLRTPLTGIIGNSSLFLESQNDLSSTEQRTIMTNIYEDSNWLLNMVENLLSVTRVDTSTVRLSKNDTVLEELIDAVLVKFHKHYPDTEVHVEIPEEFVSIPMDAMLISQVLMNLLENAVFHAKGMKDLWLRVEVKGFWAYFYVEDDGCGIPEEKLPKLFTGMLGSEAPMDQSRSSMGIGLSVCSAIIKAHGGEIWANKRAGGGTEVGFRLEMEDENGE